MANESLTREQMIEIEEMLMTKQDMTLEEFTAAAIADGLSRADSESSQRKKTARSPEFRVCSWREERTSSPHFSQGWRISDVGGRLQDGGIRIGESRLDGGFVRQFGDKLAKLDG